ncbi:MAG TPA: hypothetical protein PKU94_01935 [Candidatus Hydrothermia bacterium]|nr:hypothetical protein [Candidatus Hydrothermia bacterium]MDD5572916.1 hypothetical protein [Candidatus Hydrothermia bacterium]HOK23030.1 hypothetical protein [Candidatus Hydrothermia bacterium]HOL23710.1 hypothetical protein [Candidatus Hydrothermia bacterium]HOP32126.1 hypothetical protein [Candidatus Hydrothermia bacterium]
MICQKCNQREAEILYTEYVEGILLTTNLCRICAEEAANGVREMPEEEMEPADKTAKCPKCGLSLVEFRMSLQLGCPNCYDYFSPFFKEVLSRVVHRSSFSGERINPDRFLLYIESEILKLNDKLKELKDREEFKEAIKVRDKIRKLESIKKWISSN